MSRKSPTHIHTSLHQFPTATTSTAYPFFLQRPSHSCSIRGASLGKATATDHRFNLEVGIPVHTVALIIQPRQDTLQELRLLIIAARGRELSQPDRAAAGHSLGLPDVVLEVLHAVVGSEAVPVDGEEIDVAATALLEESGEVLETLVRVGAVADGGRTQLDVAVVFGVEGLHVGHPALDGGGYVHVGLGGEIGLVESEEMLGAGGDGSFGVLFPARRVEGGQGVPEHGDEFFGGVDGAAGGRVPVVEPADVGVVEMRG